MSKRLSRREFIGGVAAVAAAGTAAANNQILPTRPFGRTGERVTIVAIGCGNRLWAAYEVEERGVEALNLAFDSGIRYFDTAQGYGNGKSETWVGIANKHRRKEVIYATKTSARGYDDVLSRCDASLKRLQTDYLDVLHIHGLNYEDDLEGIEKLGTVRALQRLRDQKIVRFIGVTSHSDPATLAKALDRYDFDCTQMALNAGLQGRSPDKQGYWKKGGNNDWLAINPLRSVASGVGGDGGDAEAGIHPPEHANGARVPADAGARNARLVGPPVGCQQSGARLPLPSRAPR